jgi:hypothetical protein
MDTVYRNKPERVPFEDYFKSLSKFREKCNNCMSYKEFLLQLSQKLESLAKNWDYELGEKRRQREIANEAKEDDENEEAEVEAALQADALFRTRTHQQTVRFASENEMKRRKRSLWNMGTGLAIRKPKRRPPKGVTPAMHVMEKLESKRHTNTKDNRVIRKKCLVCCRLCLRDTQSKPHNKRIPNETTYYCKMCTIEAHTYMVENVDGYNEEPHMVSLCEKVRTFVVRRLNSNVFETITASCWDIHHSDYYYPVYNCCSNEKPLIVPLKANTRERRSSTTRG